MYAIAPRLPIRIEPQWNVNIENYNLIEESTKIRIEPQWNVNYDVEVTTSETVNQNRTIVECK